MTAARSAWDEPLILMLMLTCHRPRPGPRWHRLVSTPQPQHNTQGLVQNPLPLDHATCEAASVTDTNPRDLGGINAEEFQIAMKSLGLNPSIQEVKDLIKEVDPNGDGDIDFNGKTLFSVETPFARGRRTIGG